MKEHKNVLEKITVAADLASEPLPLQPLIEIVGRGRVLVENHRGVVGYDDQKICIKVRYGRAFVCGSNLRIIKMTKQQLIITGMIDGVQLCREDK